MNQVRIIAVSGFVVALAACGQTPDNPLLGQRDAKLAMAIDAWDSAQSPSNPYLRTCGPYLRSPAAPPAGTEANRLACLAASASIAAHLSKKGYTTVRTEHLFDERIASWYDQSEDASRARFSTYHDRAPLGAEPQAK